MQPLQPPYFRLWSDGVDKKQSKCLAYTHESYTKAGGLNVNILSKLWIDKKDKEVVVRKFHKNVYEDKPTVPYWLY